jgi:hypothetical protein
MTMQTETARFQHKLLVTRHVNWFRDFPARKQKFNVVNVTNSVNMIIHEKNYLCVLSNAQNIKNISNKI